MKVLGQWQIRNGKPKIKSKQVERFEHWTDAKKFLGKKIKVHLVEMPTVIGYMTGIHLLMEKEEVLTALLEVNGNRYEFWRCSPYND